MPKSLALIVASVLLITGAGCSKTEQKSLNTSQIQGQAHPTQKPILRITQPQNGSKIDADSATLLGEADVEAVLVNGQIVKTADGTFRTDIKLQTGNNLVHILANNEIGSTTATISIIKPAPAVKAGTKPPATVPGTPAESTKPTIAPKTNVIFVSSELALSIVQSPYGADLSWSKAAVRDIQGYAIVKSTTDPSPYYPKQFWTQFINDYDRTVWRDTKLEKGKRTYYRICTIGNDSSIRCGSVASVLSQ